MTDTVRFESLRRRPPVGTQVDLGGHSPLQFKADETGREFAEVPAEKAALLDAIPEGYRRVDADGEPVKAPKSARKPAPAQPSATPAMIPAYTQTSNTDADLVTITDEDEDDGQDDAQHTGQDDDQDDDQSGAAPGLGAETGVTEGDEPVDPEALDDAALRVLFEKKVGRKPSPRAGRESMIDQIKQATPAT